MDTKRFGTALRPRWSLRVFFCTTTVLALVTGWGIRRFVADDGRRLTIVGPTTAGKDPTIRPPSGDQVIAAIRKLDDISAALPAGFEVERVVVRHHESHVDPVKFIPYLGDCRVHHEIYRCELEGRYAGEADVRVIFVDQRHFHMAANEP